MTTYGIKEDVSGCLCAVKEVNHNNLSHGKGLVFYDGYVKEGEFRDDNMYNADQWTLQPDGSYKHEQWKKGKVKVIAPKGAQLPKHLRNAITKK